MKKKIIAAIVGGIIIFIWQFLTWGALNLHHAQQEYTPKQDSIISYLNTQFDKDGGYMIPNFIPGTSDEEMKKQMTDMEGKPWVQLMYHKTKPGMKQMFINMPHSLFIDMLIVWLLCWMLIRIPSPSFGTIFMGSLGTGLIVFFNTAYTMNIWYGIFDLMPHFVDALVSWGAVGLWLGWWLRRKK